MSWRHLVAVLFLALPGAAAAVETIGLRFVLADTLKRPGVEAKLAEWVETLNGYYRNSEVDLRAEIVAVDFAVIGEREVLPLLDDMARERNGFEGLFLSADEFGADYTVAVVDRLLIRGKRGCGRAWAVNKTLEAVSSTRTAFAAMDFACGAHTLAHELGHLMGLNHGSLVDRCEPGKGHVSALIPYANGYAAGNCDGQPQPGEFGDIMVGGWMKAVNGNGKSNLPLFSNPRIRDARCGTDGVCGDPASGDAARALNEHAHLYAGHEGPDVHVLPYASPALRDCIAAKYRGREIAELTELACPGAAITTLAGIEKLTALRRVDVSHNRLEEVAALEQLPAAQLERVDLRGNPRIPCSALDSLVARFPGRVVRPEVCVP